MVVEAYLGQWLQVRGAEEYILSGGKGDGMHFLCVRNGLGLQVWISLDRAGDLSRVTFKGENMGYFSPVGYVAPEYYDPSNFLASFTAGFFTTCGLTGVGSPCVDEGEEVPLHGTVSNLPARLTAVEETEQGLTVKLVVRDTAFGGRKLTLSRTYVFSYTDNTVQVTDTVKNEGSVTSPYMILYHCNMGYPLLSEQAQVTIPHTAVVGRDDHAAQYIDTALQMEKPQSGYRERCYYYDVPAKDGVASVGIYNPDIEKGVVLSYNQSTLPYFTQWKMMGEKEYVLGLEPGNCTPDGRDVMRKQGKLQFLQPGQSETTSLSFAFITEKSEFDQRI